MSIRHSILCDSGLDEETETGFQLARQSLEARLLNVEQEAMENTMVIERVLRLLKEKYAGASSDRQATLADLYTDAQKLAIEIDAAFDRIDDDIFAKTDHQADRDTRAFDDDLFKKKDSFAEGAFPFDDMKPPGLDQPENNLDQNENIRLQERCTDLARQYKIIPQISWGDAPYNIQDEWRRHDCDSQLEKN